MRNLFSAYKNTFDNDYRGAWRNACFVFDTNVLLNLYRYRLPAREELIGILEKLSGSVWIPHHVALEFQRNRLGVIADQTRRFTEVRMAVDDATKTLTKELDKLQLTKRHSLINPEKLVSGMNQLVDDFLLDLRNLEEQQQKFNEHDLLLRKIEEIFDGKVGREPSAQKEIDELYKLAESRFKSCIPPGYEDEKKGRVEDDEYAHNCIVYKSRFGDFVIWAQILEHIHLNKIGSLIFVTDDNKEDWWWKLKLNGPKTIGPRPELVEEVKRKGADSFLMYSPDEFLKYAKDFLQAAVSDETLREIRDISDVQRFQSSGGGPKSFAEKARNSILQWLALLNDSIVENESGFPTYICQKDGFVRAYQLEIIDDEFESVEYFRDKATSYLKLWMINKDMDLTIVWLHRNSSHIGKFNYVFLKLHEELPTKVRFLMGTILEVGNSELEKFIPYYSLDGSLET